MAQLVCGASGCGEILRCVKEAVWVRVSPDAVCAGDVYECRYCYREVVLCAPKPVTMADNEELVKRVQVALLTAGTPYVSHAYVVKNH